MGGGGGGGGGGNNHQQRLDAGDASHPKDIPLPSLSSSHIIRLDFCLLKIISCKVSQPQGTGPVYMHYMPPTNRHAGCQN